MFPFFHTFACNYGTTQNVYCLKPTNLRWCLGVLQGERIFDYCTCQPRRKAPLLPLLPILLRGDNSSSVMQRVTVSGAQLAWSACPVFGCVMYHGRERSVSIMGRWQCEFRSHDVIWWNDISRIPARPIGMFTRAFFLGWVLMLNCDWCYVGLEIPSGGLHNVFSFISAVSSATSEFAVG